MSKKECLVRTLTTDFGVELLPKADGRIEIPQCLIRSMLWDSDIIYMSYNGDGKIYISSSSDLLEDEICTSVAFNSGRLRIPAGFLKKIKMFNRPLIAVSDGDFVIQVKSDNTIGAEALEEFLNDLTDLQVSKFLDIVLGKVSVSGNIVKKELVRMSVDNENLPKPELFLLVPNEERSCVFRPVGNPYKFKCCWSNKKPFLVVDEDVDKFVNLYLIPGLRKSCDSFIPGFLMIDEITFGKICYIVRNKGEKTAIDKELIFMFSPRTKIGSYKVYENPKNKIDEDIVNKAKLICANPEKFLNDNFEFYNGDVCDIPPLSLSVNTIGNFEIKGA